MGLQNFKRRAQGHRAEGETFMGLDLRSMLAFQSSWRSCTFSECNMDLASLDNALFEDCRFVDCRINLASFRAAVLRRCEFDQVTLEQTNFTACTLDDVTFVESRLAYANFEGATVRKAEFHDVNFHGANLTYAESDDATYNRSNLWGVIVPINCQFWNGTFDERTRRQFAAVCARIWPEGEERAKLMEVAGDQYGPVHRLMTTRQEK